MLRFLLVLATLLLLGLPGSAALGGDYDCCPDVEAGQGDEDDCCDRDFGFCCLSLAAAVPVTSTLATDPRPASAPSGAPIFRPLPLPRAHGPPPHPPPIR